MDQFTRPSFRLTHRLFPSKRIDLGGAVIRRPFDLVSLRLHHRVQALFAAEGQHGTAGKPPQVKLTADTDTT